MRAVVGLTLGTGLAALATAAAAQAVNGPTFAFPNPPSQQDNYAPGADGFYGTGSGVPTRYETSLVELRKQIGYRARLDGGKLSPKHRAEFQQALDDTNRHFHKGRYARP